jgi:hypothetical protein
MTTKELIYEAVEKIGEENLEELYRLIRDFMAAKLPPSKASILAKLQKVKINAPEDFASNFDLYASGEKRVADNIH